MGDKLPYITLISINGKFSRKVGALIECFYNIKTVHNKGMYLHTPLGVRRGWGIYIHLTVKKLNIKNFLFRPECYSEPDF